MSSEELTKRLVETRKELFNLRFQSASGALDNPSRLKLTRQEIARILTVQMERSAQEQEKVAS
jgi:large subunit ribosomal protein L29